MLKTTTDHRFEGTPAQPAGLRISDRDREEATASLREHAAAGRLTLDELDTRLEAALSARTRAELDAQFADLPRPRTARHPHAKRLGMRIHTTVYVWVALGMVAIWLLTGMGYFWPIWPIMGWGIGVVSHRGACGGLTPWRSLRRASPTTWSSE
jgi:hypothetical protein